MAPTGKPGREDILFFFDFLFSCFLSVLLWVFSAVPVYVIYFQSWVVWFVISLQGLAMKDWTSWLLKSLI